jgi:hypothetical protein
VRSVATDVTSALLSRINRSSALWQQPGFLADIVRIDPGEPAEYFEEAPVDYALEKRMQNGRWLLLTLEYGKERPADPFHAERVHRKDVDRARDSQFLHPVVRCYVEGRLAREHHVLEDLAAEWGEPEHIEPLEWFVRQMLAISEERRRVMHSGVAELGGLEVSVARNNA